MRSVRLSFSLAVSTLLTIAACDKSNKDTTPPVVPEPAVEQEPADTCDERLTSVIEALQAGDRDAALTHAHDEFATDLTESVFTDLSGVIGKLGPLQSCRATDESSFDLDFEQGALEARLTITDDRVHGLYFGGEAFESAQHSVLGDADVLFKVYDFYPSDTHGTPLEAEAPMEPGRQHFTLILGGFKAKEGEHHVTLRKKVTNAKGKAVYESDDDMDVTFARNREGVRTAKVLKYVDIKKPGSYTLELKLKDEVSGVEVVHQSSFEVAKP